MADIRAETLYKKSNTQHVKQLVEEIYKSISFRISEAHNAGSAEIYYDLPDTFQAGNMEPADVQLVVYSRLIEMIKANDLRVGLIRTPTGGSQLHVRWPSMLDPVEKARMKKIIMDHLEVDD